MFTGRVLFSLMEITTNNMEWLQEITTVNQISRDQKRRKEECVRVAPEVFWEDADEQA
jgi:hypothetical protein